MKKIRNIEEEIVSPKTATLARSIGFEKCNMTQSLLQKYLREVEEIHIGIEIRETGYKWYFKYDHNRSRIASYDKPFSTYEKALEDALQEALNIVKSE